SRQRGQAMIRNQVVDPAQTDGENDRHPVRRIEAHRTAENKIGKESPIQLRVLERIRNHEPADDKEALHSQPATREDHIQDPWNHPLHDLTTATAAVEVEHHNRNRCDAPQGVDEDKTAWTWNGRAVDCNRQMLMPGILCTLTSVPRSCVSA